MPHFAHETGGYFLSTSLKAMFSTLKRQASLRRVAGRELRWHAIAQLLPLAPARQHYLIVRDPFARLESFYRDKVLHDPEVRGPFAYDDWQDCQRLLFPYIGVTRDHSPQEISATLRAVPFGRFIDLLPSIYRDDAHLCPQSDTRWIRLAGQLRLALRFDRLFHMEIQDDLNALAKLGIDLSVPSNSTAAFAFTPRWSADQRDVVTRLYSDDFRSLGYADP